MPRERGNDVGKSDAREKGCAYFYARCRPVCQLPKDGEGIWGTLSDELFSFFFSKKHGWGRDMGTLGDALTLFSNQTHKVKEGGDEIRSFAQMLLC